MSSLGGLLCLAKITCIVDIDKMEFLKYIKYEVKMLAVYCIIISFRCGCIYKRVDVTAVTSTRLYIQPPHKDLIVQYTANIFTSTLYILTITFYQYQQYM